MTHEGKNRDVSYLLRREQVLFIQLCKVSKLRTKAGPIIVVSSHPKDESRVYLKNIFFLCVFIVFHTQYFETDDQEFYKTKVCFILNNDVSEMDLVFAEEKYSKSGQLEKVRQHFGKERPLLLLM